MSKKWLLGACGALLAGSLFASTAKAGLLIDLQLTQIADLSSGDMTLANPLSLDQWNTLHGLSGAQAATAKFAPILSDHQAMFFNVVATVTGSDTSSKNDAVWWLSGALQSTSTGSKAAKGGFVPTGDSADWAGGGFFALGNYAKNGSSNGQLTNLAPADGNLDFGNVVGTEFTKDGMMVSTSGDSPAIYDTYTKALGGDPFSPTGVWLPGTRTSGRPQQSVPLPRAKAASR